MFYSHFREYQHFPLPISSCSGNHLFHGKTFTQIKTQAYQRFAWRQDEGEMEVIVSTVLRTS